MKARLPKPYVLLPDDAARQLPLIAPPATPGRVVPLELQVGDPMPDFCRPRDYDATRGPCILNHGLVKATCCSAVLRVRGEVAWFCHHSHGSRAAAVMCAWQARGIVRRA